MKHHFLFLFILIVCSWFVYIGIVFLLLLFNYLWISTDLKLNFLVRCLCLFVFLDPIKCVCFSNIVRFFGGLYLFFCSAHVEPFCMYGEYEQKKTVHMREWLNPYTWKHQIFFQSRYNMSSHGKKGGRWTIGLVTSHVSEIRITCVNFACRWKCKKKGKKLLCLFLPDLSWQMVFVSPTLLRNQTNKKKLKAFAQYIISIIIVYGRFFILRNSYYYIKKEEILIN